MRYFLLFIVLLSCKTVKYKNHSLLREDGFYCRQKSNDLYQFLKIYPNHRVAINEILCKKEDFIKYQNKLVCYLDTANKRMLDLTKSSIRTKKDSLFFIRKINTGFWTYTVNYAGKIWNDSLTIELNGSDYDTLSIRRIQNKKVCFRFIKAHCDTTLKPPHRYYSDWNMPEHEVKPYGKAPQHFNENTPFLFDTIPDIK